MPLFLLAKLIRIRFQRIFWPPGIDNQESQKYPYNGVVEIENNPVRMLWSTASCRCFYYYWSGSSFREFLIFQIRFKHLGQKESGTSENIQRIRIRSFYLWQFSSVSVRIQDQSFHWSVKFTNIPPQNLKIKKFYNWKLEVKNIICNLVIDLP